MINWVIGLFAAAAVSAFFGFGGVATAFAEAARIAFFILLVALIVATVLSLTRSAAPGVQGTLRTASLVAVIAAVSIGIYAWIENDMTAERAGRAIDREAAELAGSARAMFGDAGARTQSFMTQTVADIRSDVRDAADPDDAPAEETTTRE